MPIVQTGDLHVYVADLVQMQLYYSRARSDGDTEGAAMGYDRPYIKLDLNAAFAVQPITAATPAREEAAAGAAGPVTPLISTA